MADKINHHDFIELNYTGKLADGTIFDTTDEKVAKDNKIYDQKMKFGPAIICVGEQQLLPGLDQQLIGKEIGQEYTFKLNAEQAFGKRDIKRMRIMPASAFKEHNMKPYPGLQIDVDGEMGLITRVSGGRIIVNFNHPLAGKDVIYNVNILRKITEQNQQLTAFLNSTLKIPADKIQVEISEEKAAVTIPAQLPEQFTEMIGKKLAELVKLKEVKFSSRKEKE
ncbi:MAG TPA: peptidylprolyl isomerase [Candidatus Nanoarchaeia archaeon]|nr:peptidylprolyl isomerase [Candidatus Nanoarchaeia archaeon]